MDLEKLIDSIPEKAPVKEGHYAGFVLRFSTGKNIWIAGYGHNKSVNHKYCGTGYSPIEAVINLMSKNIVVKNR